MMCTIELSTIIDISWYAVGFLEGREYELEIKDESLPEDISSYID